MQSGQDDDWPLARLSELLLPLDVDVAQLLMMTSSWCSDSREPRDRRAGRLLVVQFNELTIISLVPSTFQVSTHALLCSVWWALPRVPRGPTAQSRPAKAGWWLLALWSASSKWFALVCKWLLPLPIPYVHTQYPPSRVPSHLTTLSRVPRRTKLIYYNATNYNTH